MAGSAFFVINIFKTITYTPEGWEKQPSKALLASALGITGFRNLFTKNKKEHLVSLPVAAVARGSVDVALNTAIILFTGVLILVFMVAAILGFDLKETAIDALLYKNWFWWGLDLIADGLVLIFVAGTWYLAGNDDKRQTSFYAKHCTCSIAGGTCSFMDSLVASSSLRSGTAGNS